MGLITTFPFSDFSIHKLLRFDYKYLNYKKNKKSFRNHIKLKDVLNSYFKGFAFKGEDFQSNGNVYVLKGDVFNKDFSIDFSNIQYLDDDFLNEYEKFKVFKDDIIISLVGSIGKMVIIEEDYPMLLNQNNIALKINQEKFNIKFFSYIVKSELREISNVLYGNSGYSFLSIDDLFNLEIPNISLNIQSEIVKKVEPIEKEIQNLKLQKKEYLEIINEVFADEFKIDLQKIFELDSIKSFSLKLQNVDSRNDLLRTSYKWHKLETIQSFMYEKIDCIEKLGKFITQTKNGWSPESSEIEEGIPVLGQEHILKKGIIDLNPTKYTTLTKSNIQDFFVKQNDFFVSRGNTVELVALAGVVLEDIEQDIIYPDLYIKIDFDDSLVDKQYMAFLFNSFIGRIYFKHVAKGKNQTMVKVSSKELVEFYLPLPDLTKQQQIIEKIKSQIDAKKLIDEQIEEKQKEISDLIYQSVQG